MEWLYVLLVISTVDDTVRSTILAVEPKAGAAQCRQYLIERSASLVEIEAKANAGATATKARYHIVATCMEAYRP